MLISEFGYNSYIQGEVRDLPFCLKQETLLDLSQTYQSTSPIPLLKIFEHPLYPFSFKRRWAKHSLGRMSPHSAFAISRHRIESILTYLFLSSDTEGIS